MSILMFAGLFLPLLGTTAGAAVVLFSKQKINERIQCYFHEFAAGVMMAASVWSLLLPALEQAKEFGRLSFFPAGLGLWIGLLFLAWMSGKGKMDGDGQQWKLLLFAIVIHNIPEGMAVGVVLADSFFHPEHGKMMAALMLAAGIAIQNIPEGAIVSLPLLAHGMKKRKACLMGILSGLVEPIAGIGMILLSKAVLPFMPYLLGFAAGAMIYVIVEELIPCSQEQKQDKMGTLIFAVGFSVMMILDVALG